MEKTSKIEKEWNLGAIEKQWYETIYFYRITEGSPPSFEKNTPIKMGEENEVVTYFSESRFEDSIETICEIVLILLVEFTEEYQFHYVIRDYARE